MRHRRRGRKFSRDTDHRKSLIKNLINQLLTHERIVTTEAKAKEVRPHVEKIITMARKAYAAMIGASTEAERQQAERTQLHFVRLAISRIGKQKLFDRAGEPVATAKDRHRTVIQKLFEDLGPRMAQRPGGYTRILKLPNSRLGDAAPQVIFELVDASLPS